MADTEQACSSCGLTMEESRWLSERRALASRPDATSLQKMHDKENAESLQRGCPAEVDDEGSQFKSNIEWGHELQHRLIALSDDQEGDVRNVMAEAAILLVVLTGPAGAPSHTTNKEK